MSGKPLCLTTTPVRVAGSWVRPRQALALRLAARPVGLACNPRALTGGRKPLLGARPFVQESLNGSRRGGVQQASLARAKVAAALATPAPPPLAPAAPVFPHPTGTPAKAPAITVQFEVPACQVPFGDGVVLVGDAPELGAWDPQAGLALEWGEGHTWSARVSLSAGEALNFKVVKALRCGAMEWEQGDDRCVALPVLSPLLSACGMLKVTCSFGDVTGTLVQLVGDKAKLQAAVSAATGRATELCRKREELRERMMALEAHVDESDRKLHEVSQRVQQAVGKQQWVQVGHMQWRRVPAPAASTGVAGKQAAELAQQPGRAPAAAASPAASPAPAANGGRLPTSGTASGAPPLGGFPLPQAAEQLVREVVELGEVAADVPAGHAEAPGMNAASAALAAAAAAFAVAGVAVGVGSSGPDMPLIPAKRANGANGEGNGTAAALPTEASLKAPATPEAFSNAALPVQTLTSADEQNSKPAADAAGAAAPAAGARTAEEKGAGVGGEEEPKLRPEFPGLVELDAEQGALTFRFQAAASVPSAAELAERFAAPHLPQAAAASLHRLSLQAATRSAPSAVNGNGAAVNGKAALLAPARVPAAAAAVQAVNGTSGGSQTGSPGATAEPEKSTSGAKPVVTTPPVANGVGGGAQAGQAVLMAKPYPAAAAAAKLGAGFEEIKKTTRSTKGASLKALARKGSFPAVALIASVSHGVDLIKKIFF